MFFFFKQKTAYEIGTGDWSSDVCSSDLVPYKKHVSFNAFEYINNIEYISVFGSLLTKFILRELTRLLSTFLKSHFIFIFLFEYRHISLFRQLPHFGLMAEQVCCPNPTINQFTSCHNSLQHKVET